jgi:hypothetical protein
VPMKFYPSSLTKQLILTSVFSIGALCGAFVVVRDHRWLGFCFVFAGVMELRSLWIRYWEIAADGELRSRDMAPTRGYGTYLTYPLAELRYAGPVREEYGLPVSKKKDIELELEIAGTCAKRYARIADHTAFLQQLQSAAPQAEVISV